MKEIASNIYVSTVYPGVNVGFVVLPAGAIVVDVPVLPRDARAWREQVLEIAEGPILYVMLTDGHPDRLLNAGLMEAPIIAGRAAYRQAVDYTGGFWRSAIDVWARRYPEMADELAAVSVVLPEILVDGRLTLHKGGEDVTVKCFAGAAPGSTYLYFQERGVFFVGDTLVVESHPFMDAEPDTRAWLNTLTWIRSKCSPETLIVPGRGPLCDQTGTRPLSKYIALVRRRARALIRGTRDDMTAIKNELLDYFPVPEDDFNSKLVKRRVRDGLNWVLDELKED